MRSIFAFLHVLVSGGRRGSRGAGGAAAHSRFNWQLASYASSIILGAGLLTMPMVVPAVGVVPFLAALGGVLVISERMYEYAAAELIDANGGANGMGAAAARRAGTAGWLLSLLGMLLYIVPATIAYATIGVRSLMTIVTSLTSPGAREAVAGIGTVAAIMGVRTGRQGRTAITGPAILTGVWLVGAAMVSLSRSLPALGNPNVTKVLLLAVFAAGIAVHRCGLAARLCPAPETAPRSSEAEDVIAPHHRLSVTTQILQGAALAILILLAVIAGIAGWASWGTPVWFPEHLPSAADAIGAIAIILFAGVGTGWIAMTRYPSMHTAEFRSRVVRRSIGIVATAQIVVVMAAVMLLPTGVLLSSNGKQSQVASALAGHWHESAHVAGGLVTATVILAAMVVLVAVTNACTGFVETLGSETRATLEAVDVPNRSRFGGRLACLLTSQRNELVFYTIAAVGAGAMLLANVPILTMIALAGLAGGTVITFIQPVIVAPWAARNRAVAAGLFAVALVALGVAQLVTGHATMLAYLQVVFPLAVAAMTIVVCRKLSGPGTARPAPEVATGPDGPTTSSLPTPLLWNASDVPD